MVARPDVHRLARRRRVIQGWINGIPGMKVGGRRELIIPPALAYKNQSNGPIPANSTLIFIVDLLKVEPASSSSG